MAFRPCGLLFPPRTYGNSRKSVPQGLKAKKLAR
jgi:hypothetical protein